MDAAPTLHPTDQTLHFYGLGKLEDGAAEEVNRHLEDCVECRQRVASMSADSFLGRVRNAHQQDGRTNSYVSLTGKPVANPPAAETMPPGLADHPDYEVLQELGRGGMGVVYLAHNKLMGRDEVLKVMSSALISRPGVLDRFLREIRAVAKLHHPNIVTAYSAVRLGDSIVFAMQYVEGMDLSKLVKLKGPLPVAHACSFIQQAALGLQHAHEAGLVHRDIKPGNLMLSRVGGKSVVKVLDFGLAKATREGGIDSALTHEGQALGTPDYIAPEQILDAQQADIRADIYSLGGTLFYLLTGRPPFLAKSLYDLYQAHISRDTDPLNLIRPEVPAELAALVSKMMAKDVSRRFQEPDEVAQALVPFFKKAATAPAPSASPKTRPSTESPTPASNPRPTSPPPLPPASSTASPVSLTPAQAQALMPFFGKPDPVSPTVDTTPARLRPSLVDLGEEGIAPKLSENKRGSRRQPWLWPMVGIGALFLGVLAWQILRVNTPDGVILIENMPKDAVVTVDGNRVKFQTTDGKTVEIRALRGRHQVEVTCNDVSLISKEVEFKANGGEMVRIRIEPTSVPESSRQGIAGHDDLDFAPIFNGKDLSGWECRKNGQVIAIGADQIINNGELHCPKDLFGIVRSKESFQDFVLRLQYSVVPDSIDVKSGVWLASDKDAEQLILNGVRSPSGSGTVVYWVGPGYSGDMAFARPGGDLPVRAHQVVGVERPAGEWNDIEIRSVGRTVTFLLNGILLNQGETSDERAYNLCISGWGGSGIRYRDIRLARVTKDWNSRQMANVAVTMTDDTPPGLDPVGIWSHRPGQGISGTESTLYPDGTVVQLGGIRGSWSRNGRSMTLRWPNKAAPGGAWIDEVRISEDGKRYEGTNQQGVAIRGERLRSGSARSLNGEHVNETAVNRVPGPLDKELSTNADGNRAAHAPNDRAIPDFQAILANGTVKRAWRKQQSNGSGWIVGDGELVAPDAGDKLIHTPGSHRDFIMKAEVKLGTNPRSLFVFRSEPRDGRHRGYSVGLGSADILQHVGSIFKWAWMSSKVSGLQVSNIGIPDADEWFPIEVEAVGTRFTAKIGNQVIQTNDPNDTYPSGVLGFYAYPGSTVKVRNLELCILDDKAKPF